MNWFLKSQSSLCLVRSLQFEMLHSLQSLKYSLFDGVFFLIDVCKMHDCSPHPHPPPPPPPPQYAKNGHIFFAWLVLSTDTQTGKLSQMLCAFHWSCNLSRRCGAASADISFWMTEFILLFLPTMPMAHTPKVRWWAPEIWKGLYLVWICIYPKGNNYNNQCWYTTQMKMKALRLMYCWQLWQCHWWPVKQATSWERLQAMLSGWILTRHHLLSCTR